MKRSTKTRRTGKQRRKKRASRVAKWDRIHPEKP